MSNAVPANLFYGEKPSLFQIRLERKLVEARPNNKEDSYKILRLPGFSNLLGPSRTWKVFKKQSDAIAFRKERDKDRKNGLMSFTFEQTDGVRSFLVAHPIILWFINSHRPLEKRCSYEIIEEGFPCRLYVDLEFEIKFNPECDGNRMVDTIIQIICGKLKELFSIECDRKHVLELDATTEKKFSKHLIFQTTSFFVNNYAVGSLIKDVCGEITCAILSESIMTEVCQKYNVIPENIKELQVMDRKNMKTFFVDSGVYTKNRHFRLLNCTKLNKNNPLKISQRNLYRSKENFDYSLFLDSLITYIDGSKTTFDYNPPPPEKFSESSQPGSSPFNKTNYMLKSENLEDFLSQLVAPKGQVRKNLYFSKSGRVVYEVVGYRYCGNIRREHKRNNIKLVVNLKKGVYYQKCFDPDCASYKSPEHPLPASILLDLDEDDTVSKDLNDVADSILTDEALICMLFDNDDVVPDMGLSDVEIANIAECMDWPSTLFTEM